MNTQRPGNSTNDLPIAESTQIESTIKTPLKRLRLTLANKFGLRSNPNSPSETPQPKRNSSNHSLCVKKLDPQIYLDTQSNGFASRVVKYHEASEARNRDISNKTYRRLGDFPIVNLDKSEINLNQKQANAPKVAKINIAAPINLVSASARSAIFRTGKNLGDSYTFGPIGKIGSIGGRKPIRTQPSQDEQPIVPSTSEYDSGPAPSSLEALTEISRKRIHCDEIDGDAIKKQRNEASQSDFDQVPNASKRTRDRSSPSYCSSSTEAQKKRYKNNDILSSLSSSILINTPKRSLLNVDATTPTKNAHFNHEHNKDAAHKQIANNNITAKQKTSESSRVGTSNSDLPLHRSIEPIKPVIKSMSDGYVPKPDTSKVPKLTLFNRDYSNIPAKCDRKRNIDNEEEYSVSFVKPKSKPSTLFSGNKHRDQKSKLELMLSFLRGDESKDEVDSVRVNTNNVAKSSDTNTDANVTISSTSANLTTNTSVTFSTATTTSVLNAPSNAIKTTTIELSKDTNISSPVSKTVESIVTSSLTLTTSTPLPTSSLATKVSTPNESSQATNSPVTKSPTVTFNLPNAQISQSQPISSTITTTTSNESVPRLGGFSFSATSSTFTSPLMAKPATAEQAPISKNEDNKLSTPSPPTFSFGVAKSTASSSLPPPYTAPTFGVKTDNNTTSTQSITNQTTTASMTFSFGSAASKPTTLTTSSNVSFGTPTTSTNVTSILATNPATNPATVSLGANPAMGTSMFSFGGGNVNTTTSTVPLISNTLTTSASATSTPFAFGSNVSSTSTPTFGFGNPSTNVTTAALGQPTTSLVFGTVDTTNKPASSAFQFGNSSTNVTTASMAFGSSVVSSSTPSTALFGTMNKPADQKPSLFGTPSTQSVGLGAFSAATPTPSFGQPNPPPAYGQTNSTPTFGNITNTAAAPSATPTTTSSTNLFGSAQNTPLFGSSNPLSTPHKVENAFGISNSNNSTPVFGTPNQTNTFGSSTVNPPAFGSTNSMFGSVATTQNQPTFGSTTNLFSSPATTTQTTTNTFGSPSVFTFGQNASQLPATTVSTGVFGTSNTTTNTNSPFVFGQNNATAPVPAPAQSNNIFGGKPTENTSQALSAPPAFGSSTSPAFNFTSKPVFGTQPEAKSAFSFNATPSTAPANVSAFGSAPAAPQFGTANGIGTTFSFNATNSSTEAAKQPFAFGGPTSAPVATQSAFSFNAPAPTQNAFQFNAQQPPTTNIFSIGPGSGTNTTKTGRPMRTATRRIK